MDVTTAMRRAAVFFADREAVVHGNDRLTFAQAWERGCRLANGLLGLGLKPGDRVAVLEGNSMEAADFFLGPLESALEPDELAVAARFPFRERPGSRANGFRFS